MTGNMGCWRGMNPERDARIDYLKGVAIVCMVYGHCIGMVLSGGIHEAIYLWHMPLFILLSGWCFYYYKDETLNKVLVKRTIKLFCPMIIWGAIDFLLEGFLGIEEFSIAQFISTCFTGHMWFITVTIACNAILAVTLKIVRNDKQLVIIHVSILILIITGVYFFNHVDELLYFYPFYIIGFYLHKYGQYIGLRKIIGCLSILFIMTWASFGTDFYYGVSGALVTYVRNGMLFELLMVYVIKIGAVAIAIVVADWLRVSFSAKRMCLIGTKTLQIYTIHWIFYSILRFVINKWGHMDDISTILYVCVISPLCTWGIIVFIMRISNYASNVYNAHCDLY